MKESIIDDLNFIYTIVKNCMQAIFYYKRAIDPKYTDQTDESDFFAEMFMKFSIMELHKILSSSERYSLWSIWYNIEVGHYLELDITYDNLRKWKRMLRPWEEDFETIRNIRNKYVAHADWHVEPYRYSISLASAQVIIILVEEIVLEMLNLTLKTGYTHIETVYSKRDGHSFGLLLSAKPDLELRRIPIYMDQDLDSRHVM